MTTTTTTDIIIVEVPHQLPPRAWSALGWKAVLEVLSLRNERRGDHPGYTYYTADAFGDWLRECCGEDEFRDLIVTNEKIVEARRIARETGGVWEVGHPYGIEYQADEPDLAEYCREWIDHDLSWSAVLETPEDLRDFLDLPTSRHQGAAAQAAARREAIALGWIKEEDGE